MQVKKLAVLLTAASLATAMLTGCPWDKDDAASSDLPGGSSGTSQGGSGNAGNTGNTGNTGGGTGGESTVTNHTVTVTVGQNGKVTWENQTFEPTSGSIQVPAGTTLTFTVTPAEKYTATVTVGNTALNPTDGKYSHKVDADCAIEVKFEDLGYTVDADGTYLVHSAEGLKPAMENNKKIDLTEDIALKNWIHRGNFYGTLDGKGHTITISESSCLVDMNNGTIQNLVVTGAIEGEMDIVGGVAGENEGTIQGCVVKDCKISAESAQHVGGIAGKNESSGTITACCVVGGKIKGPAPEESPAPGAGGGQGATRFTGAIAGMNDEGTITACYWDCTVIGNKGVGNGSGGATKVDGSTTTWEVAVDEMNKKMNTGYQYKLESGKPVLVPAGDANGTAGVLNRLHQVMERM